MAGSGHGVSFITCVDDCGRTLGQALASFSAAAGCNATRPAVGKVTR